MLQGSSEEHRKENTNRVYGQLEAEQKDHEKESLDTASATALLTMLRTDPKCNNKNHWNEKLPSDVQNIMNSYKLISSLRDLELKIIVRFLKTSKKLKINEAIVNR